MKLDWLNQVDTEGETPLTRVARSGRPSIASVMLVRQKDDEELGDGSPSEMHRLACAGDAVGLLRLMSEGGDPDETDEQGETPLHKTARLGHVEAVHTLLEWGANPNFANLMGLTPLHWAAMTGQEEIVELLLYHGANPYARDYVSGGLTAKDFARLLRHDETYHTLERFLAMR